jgi:beta-lactamase class A
MTTGDESGAAIGVGPRGGGRRTGIRLADRVAAASLLLVVLPITAAGQPPALRSQLTALVAKADGQVGVAIRDLANGDRLVINGDTRFPMQSVYKFPLALAVLHRVDRGEFSLGQVVHFDRSRLLPGTWSPIRDAHPDAAVDLPLADVLRYVVSDSDNNGCDALFRLVGGPPAVERYIRALGVREMAIAATEEEAHRDWQTQFRNWTRPDALADLLERFYRKRILSEKSQAFLWKLMVDTTTGPNRLKGLVPAGVVVGHKTGSSGKNDQGVSAAVNDAGILVLPNGRQIAIAVLISGARVADEESERVIADIARLAAEWGLAGGVPR